MTKGGDAIRHMQQYDRPELDRRSRTDKRLGRTVGVIQTAGILFSEK